MFIVRRSICIDTASGIVFSVSDGPVYILRRDGMVLLSREIGLNFDTV